MWAVETAPEVKREKTEMEGQGGTEATEEADPKSLRVGPCSPQVSCVLLASQNSPGVFK